MESTAQKPGKEEGEGQSDDFLLAGRYRVEPRLRLPELDIAGAEACVVEDANGRRAYALLCPPGIPWRGRALAALKKNPCQGVASVLAAGAVPADGEKRHRFAIVHDLPPEGAKRLPIGEASKPVPEKLLLGTLLPQFVRILKDLAACGVVHRGIRPDNIFYDPETHELMLGDCVAAPAGLAQPIAYEPTERAFADPYGRGTGDGACDIFALGVTILALATGRDPAQGRNDGELLEARTRHGSFRAYGADSRRLSANLVAVLRGLLCDNPRDRWTLAALQSWMQSNNRESRPSTGNRSAKRPFQFKGRGYTEPALLARAMSREVTDAMQALRGPGLEPWVANALRDEIGAQKLKSICDLAGRTGRRALGEHEIVAHVCSVLDPGGPLYFKGLALMPDGVGPALAAAMATGDTHRLNAFGDLFRSGLLRTWGIDSSRHEDSRVRIDPFQRPRYWAAENRPGAGLERCLYGLNPSLPCQSPLIARACPGDLGEVFAALETVATDFEPDRSPVDRHIAAFAASRSNQVESALLSNGAATVSSAGKLVRPVIVLALIQRARGGRPSPALAKWAKVQLHGIVGKMNSRSRRRRVDAALGEAAESGNLQAMLQVLSFPRVLVTDQQESALARKRFAALAAMLRYLGSTAAVSEDKIRDGSFGITAVASQVALIASVGWVLFSYVRFAL